VTLAADILDHILVAEDNSIISMHLCAMLEDLGARTISPVETVGDALAQLRSNAISLAIIDLQLGAENGLVVADHCQETGTPVIVATGFADEMRPAMSSSEILLRKPYTIADLENAIARLTAP
jgi:CheY-like chemotaxis protein